MYEEMICVVLEIRLNDDSGSLWPYNFTATECQWHFCWHMQVGHQEVNLGSLFKLGDFCSRFHWKQDFSQGEILRHFCFEIICGKMNSCGCAIYLAVLITEEIFNSHINPIV